MAAMTIEALKQRIREKTPPPGRSIAEQRQTMEDVAFRAGPDVEVQHLRLGTRPCERLSAPNARAGMAILYLHGGGYVMGSPNTHRALGGEISRAAAAVVFMLDYRLAPESPFPAAVNDAVAAYESLLSQGFEPSALAVAGDSAGGGLTAATLIALRDRVITLPAAGVCISPWSDLRCTSDSYTSRADADPMVSPAMIREMAEHYLQGGDPTHPHASPNLADLSGLPPLLIQVGADEVLLDDAIALHAKAQNDGVDATLEIWDDMIHVWHAFHPILAEGKQGVVRVGEFLSNGWAGAAHD